MTEDDESLGYYRCLEAAVEGLLFLKGILKPEDLEQQMKAMEERDYTRGARIVARAWVDPAYRQRLLENGSAASEELGFPAGPLRLMVVANSLKLHNVIVCTLCSCYPRALLGIPPAWYKSREYRSRVVREPRKVLAEFGTSIPQDIEIRVHDSTAELRYMVLPLRPTGTEHLSEEELARLVTRDSLIGVGMPLQPGEIS